MRTLAEGKDAAKAPLAQAMTPNPVTITPESPAIDALRAISDGGFRHLPVVEDGRDRLARRFHGDGDRSVGGGNSSVGVHSLIRDPARRDPFGSLISP